VLTNKSSARSLTSMLTATVQPTPKTSAKPDAPLPDAPATAPVATEAWRITTGKGMRWKARVAEAKKKWKVTPSDETPNKTNSGRGKRPTNRLQMTTVTREDGRMLSGAAELTFRLSWEMAIWEIHNQRQGRRKAETEQETEQHAVWEGRGREGREVGCGGALGARKITMTMGKGGGIKGSPVRLPLCKQGTWVRRYEMDTNME
jgi:hypothetical protein